MNPIWRAYFSKWVGSTTNQIQIYPPETNSSPLEKEIRIGFTTIFRDELTVSFREGPPTSKLRGGVPVGPMDASRLVKLWKNPHPQGRRSHPLGHGSRSGVSRRFFCFGEPDWNPGVGGFFLVGKQEVTQVEENMENDVLGCFFKNGCVYFLGLFSFYINGPLVSQNQVTENCELSLWSWRMTFRRWTKYSNLEEKIGLTPLSPNAKVKRCVRDMSCCAVWFLLSTRLNPWKKKTTLKSGGARGIKLWGLVQNTLSQMLEEHFSEVAKHLGANIIASDPVEVMDVE